PRWVGRPRAAAALSRFNHEGPGGASPMTVPHLSLHAVSGTISQVLRIHGPNFGTGSGSGSLSQGVLAALGLVAAGNLPGLWLTLSQWEPEPAPDAQGEVAAECICHAVAVALVPRAADFGGARLQLLPPAPGYSEGKQLPPDVLSLAEFLDGSASARSWLCP